MIMNNDDSNLKYLKRDDAVNGKCGGVRMKNIKGLMIKKLIPTHYEGKLE